MCLSPDLIPRLQIVSCNHHNFAALQNLLTQASPHNVILSPSLNYSDLTLQLFYCADMEKNWHWISLIAPSRKQKLAWNKLMKRHWQQTLSASRLPRLPITLQQLPPTTKKTARQSDLPRNSTVYAWPQTRRYLLPTTFLFVLLVISSQISPTPTISLCCHGREFFSKIKFVGCLGNKTTWLWVFVMPF